MHDVVEVATHDAALGRRLLRELAVAEDGAEDVVEVVRNAAGERPHRFHLLRLAQLDFEPLLLRLRILARGDVDRRPDETLHLAGGIARAASAHLQPVPFAVGMPNAVFRLAAIGPSLEMIADRRGFQPCAVVGMNLDGSHPRFPSGDRRVHAAAVQELHLRRQERGPVLEIPVEVALVRALHRQGVALLALPQRAFAHFDAPDLVHQRDDRGGTEQRENQRAHGDVPALVTPALERGALVARNRDHQREAANMRDADETRLVIHGVQYEAGRIGGRGDHLGKFSTRGLWNLRLTYEQRPVIAQQVYGAALADIDRLIDALKLLEVDHRLHDAVEGSVRPVKTPRHHDGTATLDLRDQRVAQDHAETRMVPVRDEVRAVGKRGSIPRQLSRAKARHSVLVDNPHLAHLR